MSDSINSFTKEPSILISQIPAIKLKISELQKEIALLDLTEMESRESVSEELQNIIAQLRSITTTLETGVNTNANIVSNQTIFGDLSVAEQTPILSLGAVQTTSALRNIVNTTGSGSIQPPGTTGTGEFLLRTTTNGADSVCFQSAQRGIYQPGVAVVTGIGLRTEANYTLSGNQEILWGPTDDPSVVNPNGFCFGIDSAGVFVATVRNGVVSKTHQTNWNVDPLDGTGPSGLTLDPSNGNIYRLVFSWYGYGEVRFVISLNFQNVTVHKSVPTNATSITNPNLPITVAIKNNGAANSPLDIYVGGRQFSVEGKALFNNRLTSEESLSLSGIGTTTTPVISFRRKTNFLSISVKVEGYDFLGSDDGIIEIFINGTLTGASFGTPSNTDPNETSLESDTSASTISGGILIARRMFNSSRGNSEVLESEQVLNYDVPENQPISLCFRTLTGSLTSGSAIFRMREQW